MGFAAAKLSEGQLLNLIGQLLLLHLTEIVREAVIVVYDDDWAFVARAVAVGNCRTY